MKKDNHTFSLPSLLMQLFRHVSSRRRRQFMILPFLTLASSVAEMMSLGAVVPFIGILTQPEKVFSYPLVRRGALMLGIESADGLVLPLVGAFSVAAVMAGGLRLLLLWYSTRLVRATSADLGLEVYRRTLYQPYHVHISRSSSEIISGIAMKTGDATTILSSLVVAVTSTILIVTIMVTLFAIDPIMATVAITCFGVSYGMIAWRLHRRVQYNSVCVASEQTQAIRSLQEGLGAIRDVLLDGTQAVYCDIYRRSVQKLQRAQSSVAYISQSPRHVMEALGMVLIALLVLIFSHREGGVAGALPVLGVLALGAQRQLPLLQQLYTSWTAIIASRSALVDVLNLLQQPLPEEAYESLPAPLVFRKAIQFDDVGFCYGSQGPTILNGVNLKIPKGVRMGFVGSTGSGKSTLLDLVMALLEPTNGSILVDGKSIHGGLKRAWQRTIAHVPQSIYLGDTTIAENIAFGIPLDEIDREKVRQAAKQAQIAEFIESRAEGYDALVGERGVRLSGGQRQRIGIARALYKDAAVLVFDEATSALDNQTEIEVMNAIKHLNRNLTILMVAHRVTTLQHCDVIIQVENGKVFERGSYEQFITKKPDFCLDLMKAVN